MYAVCLRYARTPADAADILQEGFLKVFSKLEQFQFQGSFEGCIRRIMVNTALRTYQQQRFDHEYSGYEQLPDAPVDPDAIAILSEAELLRLIGQLPEGYRVVFNLVAIEEHQELEERFAFLSQQNDDLVNAKQQLLDLIRKINDTTTSLFTTTFNQVNENFQELFKQLFGGGNAKLVLVDEENVLESGIEIIARPPGKKLQTVSLLSGGERTLTAIALLFSLFKVKPSAC